MADSYVRAVQRASGLAVLLPVDARGPARLVDGIDALLLIGGADIDPATYGAEREPATETTYRERDDFELAMVRHAIDRDLPVLGVCRGMQILNIAFGGTLLQDLAAPEGSNIHRRQLGGFEDAENHVELEEGLPEAIEAAAGRWILGVQWHPESRDESAILASFVATARDRAAEHAG